MDNICEYCKKDLGYEERFVIRIAVRPKFMPYRWKSVGYCCEECERKGHKVTEDKWSK